MAVGTDTFIRIMDIVNRYHMENHTSLSDEHNDESMALVEAIQAINGSKWTPVTDSLPSTDGDYLVTTENDRGTRRRQVSSFTRYDDIGYSWGIETSPIYTVKAWMPLPEMWEG